MQTEENLLLDENIRRVTADVDEGADIHLPPLHGLPPVGEPSHNPLDQLLNSPSLLEQELLDFLKPDIQDKLIQTPVRYQALLDEVQREFQIHAQKGALPDALAKCTQLLAEVHQLREMLVTHRSLLVKV